MNKIIHAAVRLSGVIIVLLSTLYAEAQVAPGQWRTHFSYKSTSQVAWVGQTVYALANGKLFSYSPADNEFREHNILTGLHGNIVTSIDYNAATATLLVIYDDGDMDLIKGDDITELPDYRDKTLTASKAVNNVRMYGNYAYICTDACLLEVDMKRKEIANTYFLRDKEGSYTALIDFAPASDEWYLLTDENELYRGSTTDNLLDAGNWQKMGFGWNLPPEHIIVWDDELYGSSGPYIFWLNEYGNWAFKEECDFCITGWELQYGYLVMGFENSTFELRLHDGEVFTLQQLEESLELEDLSLRASGKELCTASGKSGIALWSLVAGDSVYENTEYDLMPNGPDINTAWKIYFRDNALYTVSGGRWGDRYFYTGGINRFLDNEWRSVIEDADTLSAQTGSPFRDIVNLAVDPKDVNHFYACSWGEGMYEFQDGKLLKLHTYTNSPLITCLPESSQKERYVRVDGATFDSDGNLWVNSSDPATNKAGVHILKSGGSWVSPSYSNFPKNAPTLGDVLFTSKGQIWINSVRDKYGIFVIDPGKTLDDPSDDKTQWISNFYDQDGKTIDMFTVTSIAEDKDGTLWIGTNVGPILYYPTSTLFDKIPTFTRVKVPRNDGTDEADYLLSSSPVQWICVDGANRKWIATDNDGVYLVSSDGLKTVHHFTTSNSPLPSNNVYSVFVNPYDGEVFIGTEDGLVSYRDQATEGADNYDNVYAYPNPVTPEFTGDILVTGLKESSQVHITDIQGHILAKGTSLGGQFAWNGCRPSGERAASGVYLVFVADEEGNKGVVCKIVLIK